MNKKFNKFNIQREFVIKSSKEKLINSRYLYIVTTTRNIKI